MSLTPEIWHALQLNLTALNEVLNRPARAAPEGDKSNFVDPTNYGTTMVAVTAVCATIASIALLGRVYVCGFVTKYVKVADVLGLIGFGFYIGVLWSIFHAAYLNAIYIHQWNVKLGSFLEVLFPFWLLRLCYALSMLFLKPAILLDWLGIFVPKGTRGWFFWISWALIVLSTLFYTAIFFLTLLSCRPIEGSWKPFQIRSSCINPDARRDTDYFSAPINLALDILLFILPQRVIWKLNMGSKQKILVASVFSIGLIACACALGRVITGRKLRRTADVTWDGATPLLWAMAELTCGIVIYCAPVARRAFALNVSLSQLAQSLRSWSRMRGAGSASQSSTRSGRSGTGRSTNGDDRDAANPGVYQRIEENTTTKSKSSVNSTAKANGIPLVSLQSLREDATNNTSGQDADTNPLRGTA